MNFLKVFAVTSVLISLFACKKSVATSTSPLSSLNGNWKTTIWGGNNDTAIVNISSANATSGVLSYLSSGAISDSHFAVGDIIFSNIEANSDHSFSAIGTYRYFPPNGSVSTVGKTSAVITLQSTATLYVTYAKDESTGIQPPDYYWVKQ